MAPDGTGNPDASQPSVDELWDALRDAQRTIRRQEVRLAALEHRQAHDAAVPHRANEARVSRAGLFKAAAAGVAALAGAGMLGAGTASAEDENIEEVATYFGAFGTYANVFSVEPTIGYQTLSADKTGFVYGAQVEGTFFGIDATATNTGGFGVSGTATGSGGAAIYGSAYDGAYAVQAVGGPGLALWADSVGPEAVSATSESTDATATGVHGIISDSNPGASSAGVWGDNQGTNGGGSGVYGSHAGSGIGVSGVSVSGEGVHADGGSGIGVNAVTTGTAAVQASNSSAADGAAGVYSILSAASPGNLAAAVRAQANSTSANGIGLYATHDGSGRAVSALSRYGTAVNGLSSSPTGGPSSGIGVAGTSDVGIGVLGIAGKSGYAAGGGYGGQFAITGTGLAQIALAPTGSTGHPTTFTHQVGEIYLDAQGSLFVCVVQGSPGTWKQIVYQDVTDARVAGFTATRRGDTVQFHWRMAGHADGVAAFDLYSAGRRLNATPIVPHRSLTYTRSVRHAGPGPFALHVVLADGRVVVIPAA
jgi:hypothetical protein